MNVINWRGLGLADVLITRLRGAALDWAVAKVDGVEVDVVLGGAYGLPGSRYAVVRALTHHAYSPSSDLLTCGQLMAKHGARIGLELRFDEPSASYNGGTVRCGFTARSMPEAVCRAIVSALHGDHILVPILLMSPPPAGAGATHRAHLAGA